MAGKEWTVTRDDYDRYAAAFNARDYDAVFDFYADNPRMADIGEIPFDGRRMIVGGFAPILDERT